MSRDGSSGRDDGLGPFTYSFRPGPGGPYGAVFVRGPAEAPPPKAGDVLTLTTDGCYDADFEVAEVTAEDGGWSANCIRLRSR